MAVTISFCTTCMGRRRQLEETYRRSLAAAGNWPDAEFILLDYHSPDGLETWVQAALGEWIAAGRVRYFRTEEPKQYQPAHAKNVAHRLARGEVLVNLDADNWFEPGFCVELARLFGEGQRVVAGFPGLHRGCMGRVAIRREDFLALGGYNEAFKGWGYDDFDLVVRAEAAGLERCWLGVRHARTLRHSNELRLQFMEEKQRFRSNHRHRAMSRADLAAGRCVANAGRPWGVAEVWEPFREAGNAENRAWRAEWDTSSVEWGGRIVVSSDRMIG